MTSAEWQTALILLAGLAPVFAVDRISHGGCAAEYVVMNLLPQQ
jgi:hypothetical protein